MIQILINIEKHWYGNPTHSKAFSWQENAHERVQRDTVVKRESVCAKSWLHTIIRRQVEINQDIGVGAAGYLGKPTIFWLAPSDSEK